MENEKVINKEVKLKFILIAIVFFAVIIDRITKIIIVQNVKLDSEITVIGRIFYITNIRNKGAAWGILQDSRFLFIPLTIIMSGILVYFIRKSDSSVLKIALAIILGGALGNFLDRVFQSGGGVIDFLGVYIGSYRFPIFNAADCCVVVGTIVLAYYILFIYKEKEG